MTFSLLINNNAAIIEYIYLDLKATSIISKVLIDYLTLYNNNFYTPNLIGNFLISEYKIWFSFSGGRF